MPDYKIKLRKHTETPKFIEKTPEEQRVERVRNGIITFCEFVFFWTFLTLLIGPMLALFFSSYFTRILPSFFYMPEEIITDSLKRHFPTMSDLVIYLYGNYFTCCFFFKSWIFAVWILISSFFIWAFLLKSFEFYNERLLSSTQ